MKQLNTASRQPLHHDPSAFCLVILGGKCAQAGIERDRSGLVENTVLFDIRKFRKFKPEFLVEWNTRTNPFPLPIVPRAPSQTQQNFPIGASVEEGAGVTYLRYTVLTSPNKDDTAVHCYVALLLYRFLSCLILKPPFT